MRRAQVGRRGAALVELAVVLPLLLFILVAGTDFARAYRDLVVVTDRARSAAIAANLNTYFEAPTKKQNDAWLEAILQAAAEGDADWLKQVKQAMANPAGAAQVGPTMTVSPTQLAPNTQSISVTVTSPFRTIMTYPGIPGSLTISRTVKMRINPMNYLMK